jgi:hypothetical protein
VEQREFLPADGRDPDDFLKRKDKFLAGDAASTKSNESLSGASGVCRFHAASQKGLIEVLRVMRNGVERGFESGG